MHIEVARKVAEAAHMVVEAARMLAGTGAAVHKMVEVVRKVVGFDHTVVGAAARMLEGHQQLDQLVDFVAPLIVKMQGETHLIKSCFSVWRANTKSSHLRENCLNISWKVE